MASACVAAPGVVSLIFNNGLTHDGCSRMNSEVYKNSKLWRNASKLIERNLIVQQNNDPKHKANATNYFIVEKKWKVLIGRVNHQTLTQLKRRLKGKNPKTNNK